MLTKYILHIDGNDYELQPDDLKNWDDIRCTYKRSNYDGVVRSFSSQFEFVNRAKSLLMEIYLRDRFNADASISVLVINDRWNYEERFRCPLDFSTISWEGHAMKINSVDNSLAALIKANKSTKYEFVVGTDIEPDSTFIFSRLPISNNITFAISEGESYADGSLGVPASENGRVYCGVTNEDDVYVNGTLDWNEDQTKDALSYMVEANKSCDVTVDVRIDYDQVWEGGTMSGAMVIMRADGSYESITGNITFGGNGKKYVGEFASVSELKAEYPLSKIYPENEGIKRYWATVQGIVWEVSYGGDRSRTTWVNQNVSRRRYQLNTYAETRTVHLNYGDKIAFTAGGTGAHVYSSAFTFKWMARGNVCNVPAMTPRTVAEELIFRISDGKVNPRVFISDYDPRLAKTLIMAAESVRSIPNAKLYTSFNEFCDWMSAVFGYVGYIGEECRSEYVASKSALYGYTDSSYPLNSTDQWHPTDSYPTFGINCILYMEYYGQFAAWNGAEWFSMFPGWEDYNDAENGYARTDTIFAIKRWVNGVQEVNNYYFEKNGDSIIFVPRLYKGELSDIYKTFQSYHFVHRSEILSPDAQVRKIASCRDLKYDVDSSIIYSAVKAGYDKKDYESVNGRDEFNFNNEYTTGCTVSDKTLSLISKYRADCYGLEFAAQKSNSNSTDTASDKDVFFVYSDISNFGTSEPDKTISIQGGMSDELFNGCFNPMECIKANAGFIGLQSDELYLKFASSTGNTGIIIDGEQLDCDLNLNTPLATCSTVEFTTDDVDDIADVNELVEVEYDGMRYRGFLKEVDIKYAKTESAKYKLIVKDIIPCS